jgi:lambda family phage minor tail protein L
MVFECTSGGTSGGSLPGGFASASEGGTITDNGVTWTAKRPIKRFHNGTNLKTTTTLHEASIHFGGKVYEPFPVQTEGFDMTSKGTLPRPRLTISNLSPSLSNTFTVANGGSALPSGTISAMMLEVNKITVGNDLIGSTLVRIRTLRKFLDSDNFNSTNATADSTQKFPDEIYMIARKVLENQEIVQFECASMFDMAGVRGPKRQILPDEFPGIGEFFQ